jgi:hypothetical protein
LRSGRWGPGSADGGPRSCGPDPDAHVAGVHAYTEAGFDEVYTGQVGGACEGFFEFYAEQVLPRLRAC